MAIDFREWLKQADYDMDTAQYMADGGRFFYAVFMCHMAVEKALKGLFQKQTGKLPDKSHNLIFFLNQLMSKPPEKLGLFMARLNEANIATRYPETLAQISHEYTKDRALDIILNSKEVLQWIKKQF